MYYTIYALLRVRATLPHSPQLRGVRVFPEGAEHPLSGVNGDCRMNSFSFTPKTMSGRLHRADGRPRWLGVIVLLACGLFVLSGCINLPVPYHREAVTYLESGQNKLRLGDHEGALADFDQVVRGYDESFRLGIDPLGYEYAVLTTGYLNRGIAKGGLGDHEGAIADYDEALLRLDTRSVYLGKPKQARTLALHNRGNSWLMLEFYEEALDDGHAAKRLAPDSLAIDVLLIAANLHLGEYETVISAFDDAIEDALTTGTSVDLGPTYSARAFVRVLAGDEQGALADADEAVRRSKGYSEIWLGRCVVKFLLRNYEGAISDCNEAHRSAGGVNAGKVEFEAYNIRAAAKAISGDLEGAATDFAKISGGTKAGPDIRLGATSFLHMAFEPGQHERSFAGALVYVFRGSERLSTGRLAEAREDFEKAQDIAVRVRNSTIERLAEDGIVSLSAQSSN